jgi:hypothetical protein
MLFIANLHAIGICMSAVLPDDHLRQSRQRLRQVNILQVSRFKIWGETYIASIVLL